MKASEASQMEETRCGTVVPFMQAPFRAVERRSSADTALMGCAAELPNPLSFGVVRYSSRLIVLSPAAPRRPQQSSTAEEKPTPRVTRKKTEA